ncbi:tetraacyldisaccharide 4'-kinase [Leptospira sp. WS60.C2]
MKFLLFLFSPFCWLYQFLFWLSQNKIKPVILPNVLVLSVGNITVGGTGKTPFVQYLVRFFQKTNKDYAITILSRGYKAEKSKEGAILPNGLSPHLFGDEPSEHKETFPNVQVIIGKNRVSSFLKYNQFQGKRHIVILDDGFQHKQIHRDFDIVLLDANAPFGNGFTLPLGFLREPISHLSRANTIVFTKLTKTNEISLPKYREKLNQNGIKVPHYRSHFSAYLNEVHLETLTQTRIFPPKNPLSNEANISYFLFTGVGNPKHVWETASSVLETNQIRHRFFPDHYDFEETVLFTLLAEIEKETILITTEKDWVKVRMHSSFLKELIKRKIRLVLLKIEVKIEDSKMFESILAGLVSTYEVKNDLVSKTE